MKKEKQIELTDTENYEGYYPTREHLLLFEPQKLKKYDEYLKGKKSKKIDPTLLNLYLSL